MTISLFTWTDSNVQQGDNILVSQPFQDLDLAQRSDGNSFILVVHQDALHRQHRLWG
jgi:ferredoxin-NADP reductase